MTDLKLADLGMERIDWASAEMPVLLGIMEEFAATRPLTGVRAGLCLHVTAQTANLVRTLSAGGAEVYLCAANPLSTQDDVAAALAERYGVRVFARYGADDAAMSADTNAVLAAQPNVTVDVGAGLIATILESGSVPSTLIGGIEETTFGVDRLKAIADEGGLACPVIAVGDTPTKRLFESLHGTAQSTLDALMRATNLLLAGRRFVVAGYGWVGRGIAARARGLGAHVIVTEVSPTRAIEAAMEGFQVMPMHQAVAQAQVIVTATGMTRVVSNEIIKILPDGCVLANAGHLDVEIDCEALDVCALERRQVRPHVEEFMLPGRRRVWLCARGRVVNLVAAEGAPSAAMDITFGCVALSVSFLVQNSPALKAGLHPVPADIDQEIARRKLLAMGLRIDELSEEQRFYFSSNRDSSG